MQLGGPGLPWGPRPLWALGSLQDCGVLGCCGAAGGGLCFPHVSGVLVCWGVSGCHGAAGARHPAEAAAHTIVGATLGRSPAALAGLQGGGK